MAADVKGSHSGSGTTVQEVNKLLKQFDETRKMMKMMTKGGNASRLMGTEIIKSAMYTLIDGKENCFRD